MSISNGELKARRNEGCTAIPTDLKSHFLKDTLLSMYDMKLYDTYTKCQYQMNPSSITKLLIITL